MSAAATKAWAKLQWVKMEPSDELPRLDLWLEKLRSSSEAEPHPFTMDPVEHRRVKQVCLMLTAQPLKAFYGSCLFMNE